MLLENQIILQFFILQLFPSMFVFLIILSLIELPSFPSLDPFLRKTININSHTASFILLCCLAGFPTSFFYLQHQLNNQQMTPLQAKRLIASVSIPSLSFMLITCSHLFGLTFAFNLWIIQLMSIFLLLFFTRKTAIDCCFSKTNQLSLNQSILFAFHTMAFILAYLMITLVFKSFCTHFFPFFEFPIRIFFEFSSGSLVLSQYPQSSFIFLLTLSCLGFGGLCVHFQGLDIFKSCQLSYWSYFKFRIIQIVIMIIFGAVFLTFKQF